MESSTILAGGEVFSTFDLQSGHHQLAMDPQSIELTAYCTPSGLYGCRIAQQGAANCTVTVNVTIVINHRCYCYYFRTLARSVESVLTKVDSSCQCRQNCIPCIKCMKVRQSEGKTRLSTETFGVRESLEKGRQRNLYAFLGLGHEEGDTAS